MLNARLQTKENTLSNFIYISLEKTNLTYIDRKQIMVDHEWDLEGTDSLGQWNILGYFIYFLIFSFFCIYYMFMHCCYCETYINHLI